MGFPENELTSNESVVMHLHPHWKSVVGPFAILIASLVGMGLVWWWNPGEVVTLIFAVIALALIVVFWLWPFMKWRATHYVFTNERVITRTGVFSRDMENIPLNRVSDVASHQSFFDRLIGSGTLIIESAGERGQEPLKEIPHVVRVARELHELIDPDDVRPPAQKSPNDGSTQQLSKENS